MSSIMVQGTASSAGKSLVCTALCRIFSRDGYDVFPFKSQNMSLNSYVTKEGLEMGRAQVLQAYAAGKEPQAIMNPILLKPTTDRKSQVVVMGTAYKNMDGVSYFEFRKKLRGMISDIYKEIERNHDIVVIEGAGSPAEINLKKDDIVNMGMAKIADAPVILVADIDRGGVFASIYGTVMLLEESERKRIKGIVINKFRGDKSLLQDGLDMIEKLVGIPVIGVIPYMNLKLDDEDGAVDLNNKIKKEIDICVIDIPYMSNFTDFDPFKFDEDVSVRYITYPDEADGADILIIPGSKNTIADLRYIKQIGFDKKIKEFKGIVFGICGGYQMMGKSILDIEGVEIGKGEMEEGLNIFDTETEFCAEKVTTNVEGKAFSRKIYGYEIHMGRTKGNANPFVRIDKRDDKSAEYMDGDFKNGRFYGTYIHGIFDSKEFREKILNDIRSSKGIEAKGCEDLNKKRLQEIDKLADGVLENIDMDFVYSIAGIKR